MNDLFQRRRRGRAVKKRSGSQFNHSALSPSAERKGKQRCECGETLHSFPKTGQIHSLSHPSPAIFSPSLCKQLVPCSPVPLWLSHDGRAWQRLSLPTWLVLTHNATKESYKSWSRDGVWPSNP